MPKKKPADWRAFSWLNADASTGVQRRRITSSRLQQLRERQQRGQLQELQRRQQERLREQQQVRVQRQEQQLLLFCRKRPEQQQRSG